MATRQSISSIWARSWQRAATAMTRSTMSAGTRAVEQATRSTVRAGTKAVGQATRSTASAGTKAVEQATRSTARAGAKAVGQAARSTARTSAEAVKRAARAASAKREPPSGEGEWISGAIVGPAGMRRYRLFRPAGVLLSERLPLLVMLHGCGQDSASFARSTRMNRVAARERFLVLYPEQDRRANLQGCWNWYDTDSGRAYREAATLKAAIDQVGLMYPVDRSRVVLAGMSAGASIAALLATRYPQDFRAVVMHSGIPPGAAHSPVSAVHAMRGRRALALPLNTAAPLTTLAWPPLLVIHGSQDRVVSARNGENAARMWAEAAGARATPCRRVRRGKRYEASVTDFKVGRSTVATLCEIEGLSHHWSGGDATQPFGDDRGPDASRMIWSFAARQFRAGN